MLGTLTKNPLEQFILIIEDNKNDMKMIKNSLIQSGVLRNHFSICPTIAQAIQFLKEHPEFSTLILDISVRDCAGMKGLEKILALFPNKIIIVLADNAHKHLGMKAISAGVQDFLLKEDFESQNLFQKISFAIERKTIFRRQLSEKLNKVKQKNQQLYQNIFNNSKDAIYICNLEGHLVDFNQSTFELFAFSEEELMEIEIHDLFYPKERKKEFLFALVTNKSVSDFPIEIEQKNGTTRLCLLSASMIETRELTGYSGVLRDITEQKKAEELRKSRDIARQSAKMKEQFIANISHEMRTPMNAIVGMSNLVIQTELTEEQYNYISSIKQSSEILLGVVNDIVAISEINNSQLKFDYKFFNLYELLHNLLNVMQYQAKEKNLKLSLLLPENIPKIIHGDKLRLNQILYNLVGNAIKFTKKGVVKIVVNMLSESNYFVQLKFAITDTGVGISPIKLTTIFESLPRVERQGGIQKSRGLGLPIAKKLVEQQGGKIGVNSVINKGSEFFFDLVFEIGEEIIPTSIKSKTKTALDKITARILLVEDHKLNQLVAIKTLEKHWPDIEILVANDGKEAIDILAKETVDIILMDIEMPNMDGYEATAYIRHKMPPKIAEIPIVAMTAHAHIAKNEKFREYGMDDCIIKPFEPKELFRKITEYTFKVNSVVDR